MPSSWRPVPTSLAGIDIESLAARQGGRARRLFGRRSLPHPESREQSHARLRRAGRDAATTSSRTASSWWMPTAHPLPRIDHGQTTRAHRLRGRPRRQLPLPQHRLPGAGAAAGNSRRSPPAPATCGASSTSTTTANTPCSDTATARRWYDVTVPGNAGDGRQHSRQCLAVARGEGVPGAPTRPAARIAPMPTSVPRRRAVACRSSTCRTCPRAFRWRTRSREFSTSHTLYISNIDYATNAALPGPAGLSSTSRARTWPAARFASTTSRTRWIRRW